MNVENKDEIFEFKNDIMQLIETNLFLNPCSKDIMLLKIVMATYNRHKSNLYEQIYDNSDNDNLDDIELINDSSLNCEELDNEENTFDNFNTYEDLEQCDNDYTKIMDNRNNILENTNTKYLQEIDIQDVYRKTPSIPFSNKIDYTSDARKNINKVISPYIANMIVEDNKNEEYDLFVCI